MVSRSLPAGFIVPAHPIERSVPPTGPDFRFLLHGGAVSPQRYSIGLSARLQCRKLVQGTENQRHELLAAAVSSVVKDSQPTGRPSL